MGRFATALIGALLLPGCLHAQDAVQPAEAPQRTVAPAASPAAAAALLWNALSSDAGQAPDVAQLRALFRDDAVVFGGRDRGDGKAGLSVISGATFVASQGRVKQAGFYECEVARRVHAFDRFATVYSVVESRVDKASKNADFVGVNSIQMFKDDSGWKIVSLYFYVGPPARAVPLDGGRSGTCLSSG